MWPIVRDAFAEASPPIRRQFRLIVVFWLGMLALQTWDSRDGRGAAGVAEFLSAVLGSTGVALLGVAHTLQRTMEEASERTSRASRDSLQQVLLALPALGFAAGAVLAGAAVLMLLRALLGAELPLAIVGGIVYAGAVVWAAQTVNRSVRTLYAHASSSAAAAADARTQAAAAKIAALQARMNPHFLFNALNMIAALVRSDARAAEQAVENLADVLRRTLDRSAETLSTVRDEVDYVRAYLALEQQRWGDRLRVEWDVAGEALGASIPPLLIQPLVENALRHGLGSKLDGGTIRLCVRTDGGRLLLTVEDSGRGFARAWREGTGLGNLRERLAALYDGEASLTVSNREQGACVTVDVPHREIERSGDRVIG
jgi:two-component sensor histidine kinase